MEDPDHPKTDPDPNGWFKIILNQIRIQLVGFNWTILKQIGIQMPGFGPFLNLSGSNWLVL